MKSIYNENLVATDGEYQKLENVFNVCVSRIFKMAQQHNLNIREVSHELTRVLHNRESEVIIEMALKDFPQKESLKCPCQGDYCTDPQCDWKD